MPLLVELQNPYEYTDIPSFDQLNQWANAAYQPQIASKNQVDDSLSVVIRVVDEEESSALNGDYRGKDRPTNVLSFPFEMPSAELLAEYEIDADLLAELDENHLGDLVVCEPVLQQEAADQQKTLQQHWAHLLVHGVLHLQGYDHILDDDAEIMETLEVEILGKLGFDNPYHLEGVET